jgi:DivIVA domain-containing protein
MTLQAADIDNIRFATVDRGYSEAEVDEFVAAHSEAERVVTEARAHADQLVADAHSQAAAARADAEQAAARLVQSARDTQAEVQAQVGRLQETQQSSRRDLRELAQHLIAIAGTDGGFAPPRARPEDERH